MESLKLLNWISIQSNGVTCYNYIDYAGIKGNHASKDLSRLFKRGLLDRERIGKFHLYKITTQGLIHLSKKMKSVDEINKKDMENKSLKEEVGNNRVIIANLIGKITELKEESEFYMAYAIWAYSRIRNTPRQYTLIS